MYSKSLIENTASVDYFLASCSNSELFNLSKTSKELKESIALHFTNPIYLFYRLNVLLESPQRKDLIAFIVNFCHKDTACYKRIHHLAIQENDSDYHSFAFICYALITGNIANLDFKKFSESLKFITEKGEYTEYKETLRKIFNVTLKVTSKEKKVMTTTLIETGARYGNYSGLNFSEFQYLSKIEFSGGNYESAQFISNKIVNCNFIHANFANSVFLVTGENCNFLGANFNDAIFIEMKDCSTENSFVTRLNALHHLLSTSKGRNSIKGAILANISNTLNQISDDEQSENLFGKLRAHPITIEHRNRLVWSINLLPSWIMGANVISTKGEKAIEYIKNAKPVLHKPQREMSISPVEGVIEINIELQKGILPVEVFKDIASQMDRRSLLSLKSSCSFFNAHPVVKDELRKWGHFEVISQPKTLWFLTGCGRLYVRHNNNGQIDALCTDFKGESGIKQVLIMRPYRPQNTQYYVYLVTKTNKLFRCIEDGKSNTPSEISLNLQEGEIIKTVVAAREMAIITTSLNRFLVYSDTKVTDKTAALDLSENEFVKHVELTYGCSIFVLTSKNRLSSYITSEVFKSNNSFCELSEYYLLAGNNQADEVIAVTKNHEIILRNTKTHKQEKIDIQLNENEEIKEVMIYSSCYVALTNAGRVFISDRGYKFKEWNIAGLKGEQVKHIKNCYGTFNLFLITDTGRVVSTQTSYSWDYSKKVEEVILGEEDLLRRFEEQQLLNVSSDNKLAM